MTTRRRLRPPVGRPAESAQRLCAPIPTLETDRLVLRAPIVDDFPLWASLSSALGSDTVGGLLSPDDAWSDFCVYVAGWSLHGHGLWSVDRDGALIGFVLLGLEWDDEEPELGYLFAAEARGQGCAAEAAAAARDHAYDLVGAGGFVSYVDPSNAASSRLARRLGARRDAKAEATIGDAAELWRYGGDARL